MTDLAVGSAPRLVSGLSEIAPLYDGILCDVWGVVHNGLAAHRQAGEALARFRAARGPVVLVSNAPRPGAAVKRMLDRLGVPCNAYDDVVTSGEMRRSSRCARASSTTRPKRPGTMRRSWSGCWPAAASISSAPIRTSWW